MSRRGLTRGGCFCDRNDFNKAKKAQGGGVKGVRVRVRVRVSRVRVSRVYQVRVEG